MHLLHEEAGELQAAGCNQQERPVSQSTSLEQGQAGKGTG